MLNGFRNHHLSLAKNKPQPGSPRVTSVTSVNRQDWPRSIQDDLLVSELHHALVAALDGIPRDHRHDHGIDTWDQMATWKDDGSRHF